VLFLRRIESFEIIEISFGGDVRKMGLSENGLKNYMMLRFKNNFAGIKFHTLSTAKTFDALITKDAVKRARVQPKSGILSCRIWTVGEDYPIAVHRICNAGPFNYPQAWTDESLGYMSKEMCPRI